MCIPTKLKICLMLLCIHVSAAILHQDLEVSDSPCSTNLTSAKHMAAEGPPNHDTVPLQQTLPPSRATVETPKIPPLLTFVLNGDCRVKTTLAVDGGVEMIKVCAEKFIAWTLSEHTLALCNYTVSLPTGLTKTLTLKLVGRQNSADRRIYSVILSEIGGDPLITSSFTPSETPSEAFASEDFLKIGANTSDHQPCGTTCRIELTSKDCISIASRKSSLLFTFPSLDQVAITYNKCGQCFDIKLYECMTLSGVNVER